MLSKRPTAAAAAAHRHIGRLCRSAACLLYWPESLPSAATDQPHERHPARLRATTVARELFAPHITQLGTAACHSRPPGASLGCVPAASGQRQRRRCRHRRMPAKLTYCCPACGLGASSVFRCTYATAVPELRPPWRTSWPRRSASWRRRDWSPASFACRLIKVRASWPLPPGCWHSGRLQQRHVCTALCCHPTESAQRSSDRRKLPPLPCAGFPTLMLLLHVRPRPLSAGLEVAVYAGSTEDEEGTTAFMGRQCTVFAVPHTHSGFQQFISDLVAAGPVTGATMDLQSWPCPPSTAAGTAAGPACSWTCWRQTKCRRPCRWAGQAGVVYSPDASPQGCRMPPNMNCADCSPLTPLCA